MQAIASMTNERVIGNDGKIPWKVASDLKWFRSFTLGKTIIVGSNTFESLPPLPDRTVFFLRRLKMESQCQASPFSHYVGKNGCTGRRISDYMQIISHPEREQFVIAGGSQIYCLFLAWIDEFYVTHINGKYDGDTKMPEFENFYENRERLHTFEGGHEVIRYTR